MKRTKIFYLFLFVLLIVPLVNAVTLDIGTNLTNGTTSVYVNTIPLVVSIAEVTNNSILLTNTSWTNGDLIVNHTGLINVSSGNILSSQFGSITSSTQTAIQKIIVVKTSLNSNLTGVSLSFPVQSCSLAGYINYTNSLTNTRIDPDNYVCSNNRATITGLTLQSNLATNTILVQYNGGGLSTCSILNEQYTQFLPWLAIILIVAVGGLVFLIFFNGGFELDSINLPAIVIGVFLVGFLVVITMVVISAIGGCG